MSYRPDVAAVMSAHNAVGTIIPAVQSLLDQTEVSLEVVVFDDGSTDGTDVALRSVADPRLRVIRSPQNLGRSVGRDRAIRAATADVVAIADADDVSLAGRLAAHVRQLRRSPDAVGTFGRLVERRGSRSILSDRFPSATASVDAMFARGQMPVAHPACAFRRAWYFGTGGYDPDIRWCEDYDLFARGWFPGAFVPDPTPLVAYASPGAVWPWRYWWENERHRRAITARVRSGATSDARTSSIAPYLRAASTPPRHAAEVLRYVAISARDAARERRRIQRSIEEESRKR
ncbi:glycosyltransferase family 2 protein [Curtobacterium sp. YC1]|uniref:glycosyltransferase family 2 protein n=1 Tax=Curtobacterium sp. YC1 TaxID=2795488 RepID=UPI0018E56466|nr:glycosyltransferase family 2 protein [Curtobacterium sp. YC1]